ncbi:hypothetical protein B296_00005965 [Ensete ventricosum]|uniref:Uncharacterized protein n=1 Tax=Ensete ventricosum TaxID=4639 RepID=A0A427ASV2_ENSVE|nr:hypothetical protein B296_00005965 [Ensete ventricosum]
MHLKRIWPYTSVMAGLLAIVGFNFFFVILDFISLLHCSRSLIFSSWRASNLLSVMVNFRSSLRHGKFKVLPLPW